MAKRGPTRQPSRAQPGIHEGTYSSCAGCAKETNCCARVRPRGRIDCPVLFPRDVEAIERFTGKTPDVFSSRRRGTRSPARFMRADSRGCFFYRGNTCTIYAVRPLDCRFFPLDIAEEYPGGRLVWIVYTGLCPVDFDPRPCLEEAAKVSSWLGKHARDYAAIGVPRMDKQPYVELDYV